MIGSYRIRRFSNSASRLAVREFIDKNVKREKFQPRYHAPPKVSATNLSTRETTVQYNQNSTWGRVQCPWCKESTISGKVSKSRISKTDVEQKKIRKYSDVSLLASYNVCCLAAPQLDL